MNGGSRITRNRPKAAKNGSSHWGKGITFSSEFARRG